MDCKKMQEVIFTDYADGRLEGGALREAEEHLASCAGCRGIARELASVGASLRDQKREEPPAGVWEKVRAQITAPDREPAPPVFIRARPVFAMAALAAAILTVFIAVRPLFPGRVSPAGERYDILSLSLSDVNGNGADYDMGTPAEEYFL